MFGDSRYNQRILEPERYQQALAMVNEHVRPQNRIGGAKPGVVSAVKWALRDGMDEQTVIRVLAIWQKRPHPVVHAGPPDRTHLSALLDDTAEAIARAQLEAAEERPQHRTEAETGASKTTGGQNDA
jgi:hypothetical protein